MVRLPVRNYFEEKISFIKNSFFQNRDGGKINYLMKSNWKKINFMQNTSNAHGVAVRNACCCVRQQRVQCGAGKENTPDRPRRPRRPNAAQENCAM
jgi:hypothetical protein